MDDVLVDVDSLVMKVGLSVGDELSLQLVLTLETLPFALEGVGRGSNYVVTRLLAGEFPISAMQAHQHVLLVNPFFTRVAGAVLILGDAGHDVLNSDLVDRRCDRILY